MVNCKIVEIRKQYARIRMYAVHRFSDWVGLLFLSLSISVSFCDGPLVVGAGMENCQRGGGGGVERRLRDVYTKYTHSVESCALLTGFIVCVYVYLHRHTQTHTHKKQRYTARFVYHRIYLCLCMYVVWWCTIQRKVEE